MPDLSDPNLHTALDDALPDYDGALVLGWPFGIAMGQVGHTWLDQVYDWQVPFQAASAYFLIAALAVFLIYCPPYYPPNVTRGLH